MGQLADLKARNEQLALNVAKAVRLLPPGITIEDPPDKQPPSVRGEMFAVDQDNRVEISLGSDDGIREGHTLEVFRDEQVSRPDAGARNPSPPGRRQILKEYQQDVIRTGDEVATRFKA